MEFEDITSLRVQINRALADFLQNEVSYLKVIGDELIPVSSALTHFLLDNGKRLRPIFAALGFIGAGGELSEEHVKALSCLELVHVCALIHDDVMDASDTRRGAPSIHRQFEILHSSNSLQGSSAQFGIASAILLGDLALVWSAKMLHESGIASGSLLKSLPLYDEMRVELMAGQYLDVYEQALASRNVERSLKVARFKSGKYSIERPLYFGAALAPSNTLHNFEIYSNYGLPLGEAFQLRDDIMGVFGDPTITGKPAGDDLREGKSTALIALTLEKCSTAQRRIFDQYFGDQSIDQHGIEILRELILETGAAAQVEKIISDKTEIACEAIKDSAITKTAQAALETMAIAATKRSS